MSSYLISGRNFPSLNSPETKQRTKGTEKLSEDDIFWETEDSSFPTDAMAPALLKQDPRAEHLPAAMGLRQPAPGRAVRTCLMWLF